MLRMFRSEWLKIRRSVMWLLIAVSPLIALAFGLFGFKQEGSFPWIEALSLLSALHAMLFLPLLTGIYAALLCRYEHAGGGWKMMLALPVSRTQVYFVKFAVLMLLLAATQLLLLAALLAVGWANGISSPVPWRTIFASLGGGWIACLPLAALQLFASVAFQSFAAPLAVNVICTLPNMLVVNSARVGPYYPWAQPMLAMLPREDYGFGAFNLSLETLTIVVLGSFCVFFAAGWTYFAKRSV
ncbi:ABC transporter permease [Cohnella nanjingensis]|uniref:ABC transporter permease n=1 Tax=Cohnella nanjingensis TaxID=1387779 RepID=A0A7X0VET5_9BACL|nr:ABC transporter permease [Cohnella nanjingensis]MBB6671350.1 ABC transporter permease [Cohnella nanjingensis]